MKKNILIIIIGFGFLFLGYSFWRANKKEKPAHSELVQLIGPLISVEGGSFEMGTPDSVADRMDNELLHTLSVHDFQIQAIEVSQALYERVMGENPSEDKTWKDLPVTNVSWNDAMSFINKLNDLTDGGYRLPTEAEWEYAARGGKWSKGYLYSGSDMLDEVGWFNGNSGERLHVSRENKPNELGLYDMSGNVWEWCSDWYAPYRTDAICSQNPQGPDNGDYRVLRGGGFRNSPLCCRSAFRFRNVPGIGDQYLGFRLVFSPSLK